MCLLMETEAVGCTYEDAEVLVKYAGHVPNTNAFNAFVQRAMVLAIKAPLLSANTKY